MCRQVLHRTLVLRTTVSDSLMAAKQYDHGPKITTTDRQTRSAGDEEVTTSKPAGSMVWTIGGDTEHWLAVVSLNDALSEYYRNDLRIYRSALESGFTDEQWQDILRDG